MSLDYLTEEVELEPVVLNSKGTAVPQIDKMLLIDADTVVYAVALTTEQEIELLPKEFYSKEEWNTYMANPTYDEERGVVYEIDIELAYDKVLHRLEDMILATGATKGYELHFTTGRDNFRYSLVDNYKGNRTGRAPLGNSELKKMLCERLSNAYCWSNIEADDIVCSKYDSEKHILCAVDKDVLLNLVGIHWNYYSSARYSIDPRWQTVDGETAMKQPYIQTLTGDRQDNIITGLTRVGAKTAEKLLKDCTTREELWDAVVAEYERQGKTEEDAVTIMRLVNMFQYNHKQDSIELYMEEQYPVGGRYD